jgi:tetratricopeptide (TPR) repeat protein
MLQRRAIEEACPDDQDRTALLANLGVALRAQSDATGDLGSLDEAIAVLRQAVAATQPGQTHRPRRVSNLGAALRARFERTGDPADLAEAVALLSQAIEEVSRESEDYSGLLSNRADALLDLANTLRNQGKLAEAETEFRTVLDSRLRVLGPDHPDTLASRNNLATVLAQQGKLAEAEAAFREALAGQELILGPDHPDTLASRNNLASILAEQGQIAEAEAAFHAVLDSRSRVLGPDHPDTLTSRNKLASVLVEQGRLAEAVTELDALLDDQQRVLGQMHPDTLTTKALLTGTLDALAKAHTKPASHRGLPLVHRVILVVDIDKFGTRTDAQQLSMRVGLYQILKQAFAEASIPLDLCAVEDRGDGAVVLVPPDIPKNLLVHPLPERLSTALRVFNTGQPEAARMCLRVALHAGEVLHDMHSFVGAAINLTLRLSDAPQVKKALESSPGELVFVVSDLFYNEIMRFHPEASPDSYRKTMITMKETNNTAWLRPPGD